MFIRDTTAPRPVDLFIDTEQVDNSEEPTVAVKHFQPQSGSSYYAGLNWSDTSRSVRILPGSRATDGVALSRMLKCDS